MIPEELAAKILRLHFVEKWPPGTIAAQVGVHHETVCRVLTQAGVGLLRVHPRKSLADPYIPFIIETLVKYPGLHASRLYDMVRERGYTGRPDHFRSIVARHRPRKPAEAYLRLRTLPGEQAQVDWAFFGQVLVEGALRMLVAFLMVLSWSRKIFLRFGLDMRMGAFLAHHEAAYAYFGGVARVHLYDNLKSVVAERVGDAIRFNETLLAFAAHHRYEPRPVAPYRGNEKARVERAIRYVRDSFFPGRTWKNLEDLNTQARAWCDGPAGERRCPEDETLTVAQAFEQERHLLLPPPDDPFPVEDQQEVRVGKTPYVRFDLNDYTVPHDHVRRILSVRATQEKVRIFDGTELIASHVRSWGRHRQIEDPSHIAALVEWKREAHEGRAIDRVYQAAPASRRLLVAISERGGNLGSTVNALSKMLDAHGAQALQEAVLEALERDVPHLHAVRQALERRRQEQGQPPPVAVPLPDDPRVRNLVVKPHSLETYDQLTPKDDDHE